MKKKITKRLLINSCLSIIMLFVFCLATTTAYAATTISNIKVRVEKNDWEQTKNPDVTVTGTGYYIVDNGVTWSKNVSDCYPTEQIVVMIQLASNEGYSFKDTLKKSSFSITNGEFKSVSYTSDGNIILQVTYDVRGIAETPNELYWDGTTARWDMDSALRNKVNYDIKISKDGSNGRVVAEDVTEKKYNLRDWLSSDTYYWEDYVTFKVRAVPKSKYTSLIKASEYEESENFWEWDIVDYSYESPRPTPDNYYDYDDDYGIPLPTPGSNNGPGYVRNGWSFINGNWYYILDGKYITNKFYDISGQRYYFDSTGKMVTRWNKISGYWYMFDDTGSMMKNRWYQESNGLWYWLQTDGKMKTGWFDWQNNRYYLRDAYGDMLTGWQKLSGTWYYFYPGGNMAKSTYIQSADGRFWYYLQSDGKLQTGWLDMGYGWMYVDPTSGAYVTGPQQINGMWYNFTPDGRLAN